MSTEQYRKLSDARLAKNANDIKKLIDEFLASERLPLEMSPLFLLNKRGFYVSPTGLLNFTEIFLESYAKKMHSTYNKEMFKPHSPKQLQQLTDKLHEAELELKLYQILQKQIKHPKDAAALTEQLLSKSDKFRKILCQNPDKLRWLVDNSSPEVIKKVYDSNITQSQHWDEDIKNRDEMELQIKLKHGINLGNNEYRIYYEMYDELSKKWSSISEKARLTNISLRVSTETRDILSKLSTLKKEAHNDRGLQLTISNMMNMIKNAKETHEASAIKQTTHQKASHHISHLKETTKGIFKHSKLKTVAKQTDDLLQNVSTTRRPDSKRK